MKCPKCSSENVEILREQKGVYSSGTYGTKIGSSKMATRSQSASFQTTALCHDCGYSWRVKGEYEEKAMAAAKVLAIIIAILLAFIFAVSSCSSDDPNQKEDASAASGLWEKEQTPLDNFSFELKDSKIYLQRYTEHDKNVWIASEYEVNGKNYSVSLAEFKIDSFSVESVIFEDGIKDIYLGCFNSTDIVRLYIPESMSPIYDYTLAYIDTTLSEIYYGGSEKDWNMAYRHYETNSTSEAISKGDYESAGSALAEELNGLVGHEFHLEDKKIFYDTKIGDLK